MPPVGKEPPVDVISEPPAPAKRDPDASPDGEMTIVFAMEVIDPIGRNDGTRYARRFTYETREEAWAKYSAAIRCGFDAYVEEVGRMRVRKRTSSHEHVTRSSPSASRSPTDRGVRERSAER
jgi:hypothetical protein